MYVDRYMYMAVIMHFLHSLTEHAYRHVAKTLREDTRMPDLAHNLIVVAVYCGNSHTHVIPTSSLRLIYLHAPCTIKCWKECVDGTKL